MQIRLRSFDPACATIGPTAESSSQTLEAHTNLLRSHPAFIAKWAERVPCFEPETLGAPLPTIESPTSPPSIDLLHSKPAAASTRKRKREHSVEAELRQPLLSPAVTPPGTETQKCQRQLQVQAISPSASLVVGDEMSRVPGSKTGSKDKRSSSHRGSSSPVKKTMSDMRATRRGRLRRRIGDTRTNAEDNSDSGEEDEATEERYGGSPYMVLDTPSVSHSAYFPPPESSRTGASSPTRNQRRNLQFADPPVSFIPFESSDIPTHVMGLFREFTQDKEACIPLALKTIIEEDLPSTIIPAVAYDSNYCNLTPNQKQHWNLAKSIVEAAAQSQANNSDENGWYKVVRIVLEGLFEKGVGVYGPPVNDFMVRPRLYSVLEAQTVSIEPRTLAPRLANMPIPFKKVDFAIGFNNIDSETRQLYTSVFKAHPKLTLSQTEDAALGYMALLATLEVKSPDGTYNAASVQLATWWAAGLEKMRQLACLPILDEAAENEDTAGNWLMPFVGWTVVGHRWDLHVAVKKRSGEVSFYGPVPVGDTSTCYGVFQILHVLAKVNAWGRRAYYPWLVERVLKPLIRGQI